jgi:YVTN family beta-propeller protein
VIGLALGIGLSLSGSSSPPGLTLRTLVRPSAAASLASGFGRGWLVDDRRDVLESFVPGTGAVVSTSAKLPGRPVSLVAAFDHLWVASMVSDTVEEVDPQTMRVVHIIAVPSAPSGLAAGDGALWVASIISDTLSRIDPNTASIDGRATLAAGAVRVAFGLGGVWVTGTTDALSDVDPQPDGGRLRVRTVQVGQIPIGVTTGLGSVWVTNSASGTLSRIDPRTLRVQRTLKTGPDPVSVAVAGSLVYVIDGQSDDLRVLAGPAGQRLPKKRDLPGTPREVIASGSGAWVAVGNPGRVIAASVG